MADQPEITFACNASAWYLERQVHKSMPSKIKTCYTTQIANLFLKPCTRYLLVDYVKYCCGQKA